MRATISHPQVRHPNEFLNAERRVNDRAMRSLGRVFGSPWTTYAFIVIPLIAEYIAVAIQSMVFFLASGWVQLFALPLLVYLSNKGDRLREAKADADHQALTSVHATVDEVHAKVRALLERGA